MTSIDQNIILPILRNFKTIAVIGLSPKPERAFHRVATCMQKVGYCRSTPCSYRVASWQIRVLILNQLSPVAKLKRSSRRKARVANPIYLRRWKKGGRTSV
ncbi:MAG TPA: hypothetical protein HPQ00_16350 [Magnetococcales bacterium]|nr:hypothetical protein [Magnetococcales bacterium]